MYNYHMILIFWTLKKRKFYICRTIEEYYYKLFNFADKIGMIVNNLKNDLLLYKFNSFSNTFEETLLNLNKMIYRNL